ncbi:bacteriocin immunity protein [Nocardia harenae]|uniref:bacteriocin immunity protein n=1 Tax=Nocardia harenae TaxID=358707 RepID=UPI00082F46FE|nr:bacteriocin immunity protein [Nocardia harenae]
MAMLDRGQMLELVTKLCEGRGTDEQHQEWLDTLEAGVADPQIGDYIFWDESDPPLTPEQIVDKALAYRPIALGGPE